MRKMNMYFFMSLMVVGLLSLPLEGASGASTQVVPKTVASHVHEEEDDDDDEYDIMERDEMDDTDVLAIPFDESEIEDEEQIDFDEKKEVFHLPHAR